MPNKQLAFNSKVYTLSITLAASQNLSYFWLF